MEKKGLERLKTGISGLDEIIGGGIPKNHLMLVTGTAGAGKTIFCSQYIYEGITKYKDSAIYLSFEEPVESIKTLPSSIISDSLLSYRLCLSLIES